MQKYSYLQYTFKHLITLLILRTRTSPFTQTFSKAYTSKKMSKKSRFFLKAGLPEYPQANCVNFPNRQNSEGNFRIYV